MGAATTKVPAVGGRWARLRNRSWRRPVAAVATVLLALPMFAPVPVSAGPMTLLGLPSTNVIVTGSSISSVTSTVTSLGGSVVENLTAINGVLASVPNVELPVLEAVPGLLVSPDLPVSVSDAGFARTTPSGRSPAAVFPQSTGATELESQGVNGRGVAVAVLDTGIDNLPDFSGRLVDGVDLSGEGNPYQDSYGHGTFVAGLIAGNGASSGGQYTGEAPGANLVSVKAAGASGQTDMATVILGIGWTMDHRSTDHIGVLNLSLGMQPYTSTVLNPLDKAVEAAWGAGITVVVAAGNAGPFNGTILSPGDDPMVVTVGAIDDNGTAATSDDSMPSFSSVGPTNPDGWFKPDVVASGRSVVSLRAPGSTVDRNYPSARIGSANFVGSGTSFSTAVASGAAALVVQADGATVAGNPNAVKARLLGGATPGPVGNPAVDGHGSLNAFWAATAAGNVSVNQTTPLLPVLPGTTVSLATTWSASSWNPNNWTGSIWNGTAWDGSAWDGTAWDHTAWDGTVWDGTAWDGTVWNGTAWDGTAWDHTVWNGTAWDHTAWDGTAWDGTAWDHTAWDGTAWDSSAWG